MCIRDRRQTHEWAWTSLKGNPVRVAPENDGHGLIMLYRAAWMRHHPEAIERLWAASRDYAEWVCFLADNPIKPGQPADTLYTVSECSGFGGLDVHSHALCRAGLAALAQLARQRGETALAERWEGYVARLSRAMRRHLTTGMPPRWKSHPASDWQSGAEALTPLLSLPDWLGYDPAAVGDPEENRISRLTFDALASGGKWWLRQRMIGYDMALVTQAALLFDDERFGKLLDALCKGVYSAHGPDHWIVSEGANMHESERMWYRAGMGGNTVHFAETLKVVRLMAGVDDLTPGELKLMPRVPADWSGITVEGYPLAGGADGQPRELAYDFRRGDNTATLTLTAPAGLRLSARLGPFHAGAPLRATVNGKSAAAETVLIGGRAWLRLRNLPGGKTHLEVTEKS